jgi:hypothetical protein
MTIYVKLLLALTLLVMFGVENYWMYTKGRESVFKGIISGTATFQKKQEELAKEDVAQTTVDTKQITRLEKERDALKKQLAATRSPSGLSGDDLLRMQQAIRDANKD